MRTVTEQAVSTAIVELMRGVVYRESAEDSWLTLQRHGAAVRDHFTAIGVDVIIDDTEGYAFLRSESTEDDAEQLPRLVKRRSLTFNVSLLLVLLRKRLVEFETSGHEGKLVLTRDQLLEMLRVFLGDTTNEARVIEKIDTTIKQVSELGFIRQLRGQPNHWEVRRILKAYVDAQTMADFAGKLSEYADSLGSGGSDD